jgi:endogenous inhibitor of DNA gyrase (YacG/DUF329 family)
MTMYENSESSRNSQPSSQESSSEKAPANNALLRCAYCGKKFERASTPCMPFCSTRCHQIDLGMWLNESYGLPWEGGGEADEYIE